MRYAEYAERRDQRKAKPPYALTVAMCSFSVEHVTPFAVAAQPAATFMSRSGKPKRSAARYVAAL
jgi:hypothetical protein